MSSFHSRADDVEVDDAGQRVGQVGELVIVRREERLRPRASVRGQMLGDGPGEAQAVERGGAAADLVEDDQAARASRVCRMLAVSCISTMNVDWPRAMLSDAPTRAKMRSTIGSFAVARRHERAGLRHQADQRRLAQVGGLAAHVRARSG